MEEESIEIDLDFDVGTLKNYAADKIKKIYIGPNNSIKDMSFLKEFRNVESIKNDSKIIIDFSFIKDMKKLCQIDGYPDEITGFIENESVESIFAKETRGFRLSPGCKNLKQLGITGCKKTDELFELISSFEKLDYLFLQRPKLSDFTGFPQMKSLSKIHLYSVPELKSFAGLNNSAESLTSLELENVKNISSYDDLKELKNLTELVIVKCKEINDFSFLKALKNLQSLRIIETKITAVDLGPLENIPKPVFYHTGIDRRC